VGSTTIDVGRDAAAAEEDVQAFVDAYNALSSSVRSATAFDSETDTAGLLQGDSVFTGLLSSLRLQAGGLVGGLAGSDYNTLASVGIDSDQEGTLTLDSAAFQEALASDPDGVAAVFGLDDGDSIVDADDGVAFQIEDFAERFSDQLDLTLSGFTSEIRAFDDQIARMEARLVVREEALNREFTALEVLLAQYQSVQSQLTAQLAGLQPVG